MQLRTIVWAYKRVMRLLQCYSVFKMDLEQFNQFAKVTIDYIADYMRKIPQRNVLPNVEPGYLKELLPAEAPENGECFKNLLEDFEKYIVPGLTQWQSPNFFAHYPAHCSYPSAIADLLSTGLGLFSFNWITSPAITELEVHMMDWLAKLLDLPKEFLNCSEGPGGGIMKGSASEATLVCLLAAKERTLRRAKLANPHLSETEIKGSLVLYSSDESNSSVEKAGILASVIVRLISVDEEGAIDEEHLLAVIESDVEKGLIPCYLVATLGTTGTCSFDDLEKIGPICERYDIWMHIDAAYAGAVFACPEYRYLKNGIEYAQSFNYNLHKWMLVHFTCSALWVKDSSNLTDAFNVERSYLQHDQIDDTPEYLHWQIPLGRKFSALKVWFVLRTYGAEGIRRFLRRHIKLAKYFAGLVNKDQGFEVVHQKMGLVAFRMRGSNEVNEKLLEAVNREKFYFLSSYTFKGKYLLRVIMNNANERDLLCVWEHVRFKARSLQVFD